MRNNYEKLIKEDAEELRKLELKNRNSVVEKRLSMLRQLKTKEARSINEAAKQISYSLRQTQRWFKSYQQSGLEALLSPSQRGKTSHERMTETAWAALNKAMEKGEIATYAQARKLLAKQGVVYKDDTSILKLFRRHGIKAKTGRPRHEKADLEAQLAFKKTLADT